MEFKEYTAKTVDAAVADAMADLGITSDLLEYEVVEKGSTGILGIGSRPAVIRAKKKFTLEGVAEEFLSGVFDTLNMDVETQIVFDEDAAEMSIDLIGDDMGILIGKRGQTLDSLQYLTGLAVNKYSDSYIRVKLDIENYRERRMETLENLALNIAKKVKRTRRPMDLEPMNPYERRIIHSTLQNDRYVITSSEGEEPYRHVVVSLKKNDRYSGRGNRYNDED